MSGCGTFIFVLLVGGLLSLFNGVFAVFIIGSQPGAPSVDLYIVVR